MATTGAQALNNADISPGDTNSDLRVSFHNLVVAIQTIHSELNGSLHELNTRVQTALDYNIPDSAWQGGGKKVSYKGSSKKGATRSRRRKRHKTKKG